MKDWERAVRLARKLVMMMSKLDLKALVIHKLNKDGWHGKPDLQHFAGGSDLSYDVVSVLVLVAHIPDDGQPANDSYRTVINIKPQPLVQETRDACVLWKDPDYPRFGLAARQAESEADLAEEEGPLTKILRIIVSELNIFWAPAGQSLKRKALIQ
jgi:hypothetical protein